MISYNLTLIEKKTYIFTALFIVGNLVLPQICHVIPGGGLRWLPIYFFTLIGAYKYGLRVGLMTAIFSPIINYLLFGMPPISILPIVLGRSLIIAILSSIFSAKSKMSMIVQLSVIVVLSAILGLFFEMVITNNIDLSVDHLIIGIPGLICHILLSFAMFKTVLEK